jgi:hypothetical protein
VKSSHITTFLFLSSLFKGTDSIETVLASDDRVINECEAVSGMRIDGTELAPEPLCLPQIPHDMT